MKLLGLSGAAGLIGLAALTVTTSLIGPTVGAAKSERILDLGPLVLLELERTVSDDGSVEWTRSIPRSTLALGFALPAALTYLLLRASRKRQIENHRTRLTSR